MSGLVATGTGSATVGGDGVSRRLGLVGLDCMGSGSGSGFGSGFGLAGADPSVGFAAGASPPGAEPARVALLAAVFRGVTSGGASCCGSASAGAASVGAG